MIYKLQRKLILICTLSVLSVVALVFVVILGWNVSSMNRNVDLLADRVSEGGGRFPDLFEEGVPEKIPPQREPNFDFITPETPFSTRHFTVSFDGGGEVLETFTESIYSISSEQAVAYARQALEEGVERGWLDRYRYKVFPSDGGTSVVFIDGSTSRSALMQSVTIAGIVLFACAALVLFLIFLLSKKAVKPIAESYEKQKQFITDANHELKTPLTLILANLDIAESELGKNEWLSDIRSEGQRMTGLVNQLVDLSRMDEESHVPNLSKISFGRMVEETVSEFEHLALHRGKSLRAEVDATVLCLGDEALLRKLVGILLDNAVKYCDGGGEIFLSLQQSRQVVLTVENTYGAVGDLELSRLFDRFYRADRARAFSGGYGIGLSLAKAIAEQHKGEISAYKKDGNRIGFRVTLRLS